MSQINVVVPEGRLSARAHQMGTRLIFFICGLVVSAWAPLIPFVQKRLQLSDARLGLLLLTAGIGSVLAMPIGGALAGRFGCRRVITVVALVACCLLPVVAFSANLHVLQITLLVNGAMIGTLDTTMNINAVLVEKESGRMMMSGFHGLWSVGAVLGAGIVSAMIWLGAAPTFAAVVITILGLVLLAVDSPLLLPYGSHQDGPAFAVPHGTVVLLGCFCFVLFICEGSVMDWSGVFLATVRGMATAHAGIGYIVFAVTMTTCRLLGDRVVHALGPARVMLFGTLIGAGGFLLAVLVPVTAVSIIGYGIVGLGLANTVPVMFSAAGRQTSMPPNLALPAMTTLAYGGSLVGPPLVGFVANSFGLTTSLEALAALLVVVAVASTQTRLEPESSMSS
jgi:fucose permease